MNIDGVGGKQFSSTYQPKKNGRKPSHLKKWIKENNVGTQDIRLLFSQIIAGVKTLDDMRDLLKDPSTPPIILFPLKAMLDDFRKGNISTLTWLTEYAFGKPQQEISSVNTDLDVSELTPAERQQVLKSLLTKAGYIPEETENEND